MGILRETAALPVQRRSELFFCYSTRSIVYHHQEMDRPRRRRRRRVYLHYPFILYHAVKDDEQHRHLCLASCDWRPGVIVSTCTRPWCPVNVVRRLAVHSLLQAAVLCKASTRETRVCILAAHQESRPNSCLELLLLPLAALLQYSLLVNQSRRL